MITILRKRYTSKESDLIDARRALQTIRRKIYGEYVNSLKEEGSYEVCTTHYKDQEELERTIQELEKEVIK